MRKLLNTLFVLSDDVYLQKENETVVIYNGNTKVAQYPLLSLENILCFSYKGASPALMGACCDNHIGLAFLSPNGKFLARATGENNGNVLLRRTQYRYADEPLERISIGRAMIAAKIYNSRKILDRTARNHSLQVDVSAFGQSCSTLAEYCRQALACNDLDELRGIEGLAAKEYFQHFGSMILQQKDTFCFNGRNKRPPLDPVNASLSFLYTVLSNDCASALESVGLDSYVGFVHTDRPGRASLALDLMEELRSVMVDRIVLSLINLKQLNGKHFRQEAAGAVYLNDDGRKVVLGEWQSRKRDLVEHPYLKEKIPWGLVPYVQSLLLARYLRGDIDGYPPFFYPG